VIALVNVLAVATGVVVIVVAVAVVLVVLLVTVSMRGRQRRRATHDDAQRDLGAARERATRAADHDVAKEQADRRNDPTS
jgi:uncharacterized membrane protein